MLQSKIQTASQAQNNFQAQTDFLPIGGLIPLTTIDFPGEMACVLFCQGCHWKCPYCHNTHLQSLKPQNNNYSWPEVLAFLNKRKNWLTAVVFSGGEPTLQPNLILAMQEIKNLGFKIGLHTNGYFPEVLKKCLQLQLTDWVGLDIKTVLDERYQNISGHHNSHLEVLQSLKYLLASNLDYELRLTWDKNLISENEIEILQAQLKSLKTKPLKIQKLRI